MSLLAGRRSGVVGSTKLTSLSRSYRRIGFRCGVVSSVLPEGNEHVPQREGPEAGGPPNLPLRHILPLSSSSSDRAALDWPPAQDDVVTLGQDRKTAITFPSIEPRIPTHQPRPPSGRRFVVISIAAAMIASSLVGMYFRAPIAAYVTQYASQPDIATVGRSADRTSKQAIPLPTQQVHKADLLKNTPAVQPRLKSDGSDEQETFDLPQTTKASQATGFIGSAEERDRSAPVTSPAVAQRHETPMVLSNEAGQLNKAANTAASDMQRERERAEALASELAKVRRELEAAAGMSKQKDDEIEQFKRKAETAAAELKQSLQQERQRAEALSRDLGKVPQGADALVFTSHRTKEEATRTTQIGTDTPFHQKNDELAASQSAADANAERRSFQHQDREPIWSRYVSSELRIGVDLPRDVFVVDGGPTKNLGGQSFRTADGRADVSIYSIGKTADETPKSFLRNRFQMPSSSVVYRHLKGRVLALSGFRGDMIWYARCNFATLRVNCVALNYPAREKRNFDAIVTRISNTLSIPSGG